MLIYGQRFIRIVAIGLQLVVKRLEKCLRALPRPG